MDNSAAKDIEYKNLSSEGHCLASQGIIDLEGQIFLYASNNHDRFFFFSIHFDLHRLILT